MLVSDLSKLQVIFDDKKNAELYLLLLQKITKKKKT
tara:strand:- start:794 stop:901 length:108 start_codon:yes stop_codon:yes gene_type:complete